MIPPVKKECPPYYMNSVMKRFGHHLSIDQTHYLTGRMASSLHSAPEGSTCSLPRSIREDHQQQAIHPNSHQNNSTTNQNVLLIPNHPNSIIHTSQINHTSSSYHNHDNSNPHHNIQSK